MSKKPDRQADRVTYDVDTGVFSRDVDTKPMRRLQEDASVKLAQEPAPRVEGFDPYSTATSMAAPAKPRRTLDDMRKLSEEIKRHRGGK